jgi:type I restriction enzyme R subunit
VEKGQKENGDGKIQLTDENGEVVKIVDPNEYEKKKSVRLILKQLGREPKVMRDKADFIVAHFMENTFDKIDHKAKAMLVCESRAAVVEYKHLIDEIIKVKYNDKIKTLGAFSGSVEYNGTNVTEETLNGTGLKDN